VKLSVLFAGVETWQVIGSADTDIKALTYRSDQAGPGALFFCVPGHVRDGHDFASQAVAQGATALCVERPLDLPVAQVVVPSVRAVMGSVAAAFYGYPSRRLLTAGVTGTNGKTTSTFLVAHLCDCSGLRAGLIGTVERRIGGQSLPAGRTTPEAVDIQRDLAEMVAAGDQVAVMEVSSHALDQGRARGLDFRVVTFTNLTQDHLDYHVTMEAYFGAKSRLFLAPEFASAKPLAVLNLDDPFGRRLAIACGKERVLGFSTRPLDERSTIEAEWTAPADLEWSDFEITPQGNRGALVLRGRALELAGLSAERSRDRHRSRAEARFPVATRLVGSFNVANTLTALGVGLGLGLDFEKMLADLLSFSGVPGRMETVDEGQDFLVLVDYAHTPDSVRNVLVTARQLTRGRLLAVLGCGGDRDRTKRPLMGREGEKNADVLIVTSDNPRTEDPLGIINDILQGLSSPSGAVVEPDRRQAIATAISLAEPGDVVMILGKGHERGQEFAGFTLPFDDREVARETLRAHLERTRGSRRLGKIKAESARRAALGQDRVTEGEGE